MEPTSVKTRFFSGIVRQKVLDLHCLLQANIIRPTSFSPRRQHL
jgi:hypothetical protein